MSRGQRVALILGAVGLLHTSMVPPVTQGDVEVCRYHEFIERNWLFTRGYEVANADTAALLSEYGLIVASTAIVTLGLGFKQR